MSDGNFNRSLLPHDPFHSGLNAGKAQMRMKALEAFKLFLELHHPDCDERTREELVNTFRMKLA